MSQAIAQLPKKAPSIIDRCILTGEVALRRENEGKACLRPLSQLSKVIASIKSLHVLNLLYLPLSTQRSVRREKMLSNLGLLLKTKRKNSIEGENIEEAASGCWPRVGL